MSSEGDVQQEASPKQRCDKCKELMDEEEWVDVVLKSGQSLLVCGWCFENRKFKNIQQVYR